MKNSNLKRLLAALLISITGLAVIPQAGASSASGGDAGDCSLKAAFIGNTYQAAFDRSPDSEGYDYWAGKTNNTLIDTVLLVAEPASQDINEWYLRVLNRPAEPSGLEYWSRAGFSKQEALKGIVGSEEAINIYMQKHDCDELKAYTSGPILTGIELNKQIIRDAANEFGVSEKMMLSVAFCESGWRADAKNPHSSASGLFQHLARYWAARAEAVGMPGASIFDPVANARAAAWMFSTQGTRPWLASKHCHGY